MTIFSPSFVCLFRLFKLSCIQCTRQMQRLIIIVASVIKMFAILMNPVLNVDRRKKMKERGKSPTYTDKIYWMWNKNCYSVWMANKYCIFYKTLNPWFIGHVRISLEQRNVTEFSSSMRRTIIVECTLFIDHML